MQASHFFIAIIWTFIIYQIGILCLCADLIFDLCRLYVADKCHVFLGSVKYTLKCFALTCLTVLHDPFYLHNLYPYIHDTARAFLEQCSSGRKDAASSVASADATIDSPVSRYQHVNVLVTSGSLIPSLVKCLLFRLDNIITHENGKSFHSF